MGETPAVRDVLDTLALVCSQLDSLKGDAGVLAFAAQEARFYGSELMSLAGRLEEASRVAWDAQAEVA